MKRNQVTLPPWELAIFDEASDAAAKAEAERKAAEDRAASQRAADERAAADRAANERAAADKAAADKKAADETAAEEERLRNKRGQYESREDYERRIADLNEENKNRRRENNELKGNITVLERRAITADAREVLRDAGAINGRVTELFLADMADHIKIDPKTGATVGLDKLAEWKKANPEFFKAEETAEQKTVREAAENKAADEKAALEKRGNRTANSGSRGNGSGGGDGDTGGMPDLKTLKTPEERKAAINEYKRSLRGSGSGGYGKASSKR